MQVKRGWLDPFANEIELLRVIAFWKERWGINTKQGCILKPYFFILKILIFFVSFLPSFYFCSFTSILGSTPELHPQTVFHFWRQSLIKLRKLDLKLRIFLAVPARETLRETKNLRTSAGEQARARVMPSSFLLLRERVDEGNYLQEVGRKWARLGRHRGRRRRHY